MATAGLKHCRRALFVLQPTFMRLLPTWIAFFCCLAATAAVTARVARTELAEPPPFGREQLHTWLITAKPDASLVTIRRAARQLDRDFHAKVDWQPTFDALPQAEQGAMAKNWRSLLLHLVEQRADAYGALPRHRRERFLDGQLLDLMKWYVVTPTGKSTGLALYSQILGFTSSTAGRNPTAGKVAEFLSALQARFLQRSLNRVMPGGETSVERED